MPRLLLVDDNKSIHKIAETLLAPTDIDLVCTESGKEALSLIEKGETFDAALIDIAMGEMDGWQLLEHFRQSPQTAGLPITLMAGVLDTVDPDRIAKAPIQGFLKKPIELRDLGERIHRLMESRVSVPPPPQPPVSALPEDAPHMEVPAPEVSLAAAASLTLDALSLDALTHAMPSQATPSPVAPSPTSTLDLREGEAEPNLRDVSGPHDLELPEMGEAHGEVQDTQDVLYLRETDLWPEEKPSGITTEELSPLAEIPHEESLELEDLDLDELRHLAPPVADTGIQIITTPSPELSAEAIEAASRPTLSLEAYEDAITREFPDLGPGTESAIGDADISVLDTLVPPAPTEMPALDVLEASLPEMDMDSILHAMPSASLEAPQPEGEEIMTPPTPVVPEREPMPEMDTIQAALTVPMAAALSPETIPDTEVPGRLEPTPLQAGTPEWIAPKALQMPISAGPAGIPAVSGPVSSDQQAIVQAILADPRLVEALAKAVMSHLSQETLREVAWEVMPDLAEKMQRS